MKRLTCALLLVATAVTLLFAANVWDKKPYTQWSQRDVKRVLSESPWAHTFVLRSPNMTQIRRQTGQMADRSDEGEGVMAPEISYVVALRTALPVREAVARTAAFQQEYDKMDSAARQSFDKTWGAFLAQQFPDKIIVSVTYSSTASVWDRQIAYYWQSQTLDTIKNDTYLNTPDGKRIPPEAYWVGKGAMREFQLAFPRPQAALDKGAISVEFNHPGVKSEDGIATNQARVYTKFNLEDMEYKGKLTY